MNAKAGHFEIRNGSLFGPREYMGEQGNNVVGEILDGKRIGFDIFLSQCASVEMAICVYLQTDYAGWLGLQQLTGLRH